jgi:hypothetical protein
MPAWAKFGGNFVNGLMRSSNELSLASVQSSGKYMRHVILQTG